MALIPTVFVTTVITDQVGAPVQGAVVEAKLTTIDRWQGYVVPKSYKGLTDAGGVYRLAVFPNELGTEGSEYLFNIKLPDGTGFSALATVPNRDCRLHDITELEPYEPRGTGAVITAEVAAYADTAAKASKAARKSAQEARLYALDAVPDEDDPLSFGSAKYHAEHAAKSAETAAAWAESENSPGVEGTKSSKRWAEEMTERGNFSVFRIIFITKLCLHRLSVRFKELLAKAEEKVNEIVSSVDSTLKEMVDAASGSAADAASSADRAEQARDDALEVLDQVDKYASSAQESADRAADMAKAAKECADKAAGSASDAAMSALEAADRVTDAEDVVAKAKEDFAQASSETISEAKSWAAEAERQFHRASDCADTSCACADAARTAQKFAEQARDDAVAFVNGLSVARRYNWVQQGELKANDLVEVPDHDLNDGSLVVWCSGMLLQPTFEYEEVDRTHIRVLADVPDGMFWCAIVVTGMDYWAKPLSLTWLLWDDHVKVTDPDFVFDGGSDELPEEDVDFSYKKPLAGQDRPDWPQI